MSNSELCRYSLISQGVMPREMVLLQGSGCKWRRCTYCDYYLDVSPDSEGINREALSHVTGEFHILDVINSGSCFELSDETLEELEAIVKEKNITELWFESHWLYRKHLKRFSERFSAKVHFRFGVETFNPKLRSAWNKGIEEDVGPQEIASYFDGLCLLAGVEGQTLEDIKSSIEIAERYFQYYNVNLFCPNSTNVKRDDKLCATFIKEIVPLLKKSTKCEYLIDNSDLGVG